jgi:hypothetical protein
MTQRHLRSKSPWRSPSKTFAALYAAPPAADQANASRAYPLDPTFSVFVSASQHLIIEVLRRPVEFTYGTCPALSLRNPIGLECSGERSDAEYE